jgi:hypothetical protein
MGKKKKETLKNIKPNKKLNSGFYHEYLERTHVAGIILDDVLAEHSVYEAHPAIKKEVDQIIAKTADLYQLVGVLMYKKEEKEEKSEN